MKVCIDKFPPRNRFRAFLPRTHLHTRLIAPLHKQWINGSTLRVRFMGGTPTEHAVVKREAGWWEQYANIKFDFNDAPDAEIRITFDKNDGAWSYVGIDCADIPHNEPTMNLGFLDPGTAAHEFGHAIGLSHEHQNPRGGIKWNVPVVMSDLAGPPNFWDEDTIRHNVINKYSFDQIKGTEFDRFSIMCYFFPKEWTLDGVATPQNECLSEVDKKFIGSPEMYPKPEEPVSPIVKAKRLVPNYIRRTQGSIRKPGEEDLFMFEAQKPGRYLINTRGPTNVAMRLFGPNSLTALVGEDDDSGVEDNAHITASLIPGTYYVQIRHYSDIGTGKYTVKVFYKPAQLES